MVNFLLKLVWLFLTNLNKNLPYDLVIPLWDIYMRKKKVFKVNCKRMFIVTLLIITPNWKNPDVHIGKWINRLWFSYKMSHYLKIQRNELFILVAKIKNQSQIYFVERKNQSYTYTHTHPPTHTLIHTHACVAYMYFAGKAKIQE